MIPRLHSVVQQECDVIDRHIEDAIFLMDISLVAEHDGFPYSVVRSLEEVVEGAVDLVVLAGFHLYRKDRQGVIVIDKEIDFALLFAVVVPQLETVTFSRL